MINCSVIGYGNWGKKIVSTIIKNNYLNISYICRKNIENFEFINKNIKLTNNYKEAINKNIDCVFIATDANYHYEICKYALMKKKNVFIEKPICLNSKQHSELIRIANKNKLKLQINYIHLFNNNFIEIVKLIKDEKHNIDIFKIILGNNGPLRKEISTNFDWLPHSLSMINYIFKADNIKIVKAKIFSKKNIKNKYNLYLHLKIKNKIIKILTGNDFIKKNTKINIEIGKNQFSYCDNSYTINKKEYTQTLSVSPLENSLVEFLKEYDQNIIQTNKITKNIEKISNYFL